MFPFESDREDRPWFLALALVALAEVAVLAGLSWKIAGGHFMLPLDDSYIHLQYAKQLAAGDPLVYTKGMNPSGGMTSPAYVLLLAPAMLLGLNGVKGAMVAFLAGALLWTLLPIWVYQLTKRLTNCLCGAVAAGLVLANGHLLWNFLSGMETALFTTLLVGGILAAQVWWQDERPYSRAVLAAALCLLPLTRPEGALLSMLLLAILLMRKNDSPRLPAYLPVAGLLPLLGWFLILKGATGDWRPAGLTIKGVMSHPQLSGMDRLAVVSETLAAIVTRFHANLVPDRAYAAFKGMDSMPYIPPGLGILAMLGAGFLVIFEWRAKRFAGGTLLALAWIGGLVSVAASWLPFIHQQRYLAPWTVLAVVLALVAVRRIAQLFQQLEEPVTKVLGLALLVVSLPSLGFWMTEYGRNARDIYGLLRVASFSLLDERHPIALTDAGVLAYYTQAPTHDLVGLTSPEFTRAALEGEGATLEALRDLPHEKRPRSLVGYREWFSPNFPLGDPEWVVAIPKTTITSGTAMGRFPIEWDRIDRGSQVAFAAGTRILLDLNVADMASEAQAVYTHSTDDGDRDHRAWPQPLAPVVPFAMPMDDEETTATLSAAALAVEGGRVVRRESFNFSPAGAMAGEAALVARISALPEGTPFVNPAVRLRVSASSLATGYTASRELALPVAGEIPPGGVQLPLGELLDEAGGEGWRITIDAPANKGAWISCHYWIVTEPASGNPDE